MRHTRISLPGNIEIQVYERDFRRCGWTYRWYNYSSNWTANQIRSHDFDFHFQYIYGSANSPALGKK